MSISASLGELREVRVDGATIRYREVGEGPPLLFVHGLLVNGDVWRKVVPLLAAHYRCITPDLPLGSHDLPVERRDADILSPRGVARMLMQLIGALQLHDTTVVANDTGGAITQLLITDYHEAVARVVLTPCDCFENFLPPAFKPLQLLGRSRTFWWLAAQMLRARPLLRTPVAYGMVMKSVLPPAIADSYLGPLRRSAAVRADLAAFVRRIDSRDTVAAGRQLHEFGRPVLIAWSEIAGGFPRRYGQRLADAFGSNAKVTVVPECRTFISEDQPEALARLIDGFMRGTAGEAPATPEATALRGATSR